MKTHSLLLTILTAICTFYACSSSDDKTGKSDGMTADSLPVLVTQVQKCARLYTTEYHVHKIVTHDDILRLQGSILSKDIDIPLPLGERKIAIPMDATLKAYIDFSTFSERNVERHGQQLVVVLPDPEIVLTSSKIDQDKIREYVGLTRAHFSDKELTSYEQQGRQAILASVPQLGLVQVAQENAARVLVPIIAQMGYREEDITIAFRKDLDIRQLIMNIKR